MPENHSIQMDYQSACAQLMNEGFPCPPLPKKWSENLYQIPYSVAFTTQPTLPPPYFFQFYQQQLMEGRSISMVTFGLCGHGTGSMAMHYYLLDQHFAVLLQDPLPDEQGLWSSQLQQDYQTISALALASQDAVQQGRLSKGEKLMIFRSLFTPPKWGVIKGSGDKQVWENSNNPLSSAVDWLADQR